MSLRFETTPLRPRPTAPFPPLRAMAETTNKAERVQCFGRKKMAVAVALVRTGSGQVRINGCPLTTVKPDILRVKAHARRVGEGCGGREGGEAEVRAEVGAAGGAGAGA